MRKLGTWLGVAAIALQVALPLLAGALPRSVALVPLCTVDGVTHYVEVPTGKGLPDTVHGNHCALCCIGHAAAPAAEAPALPAVDARYERPASALQRFAPWTFVLGRAARAPPSGFPAD